MEKRPHIVALPLDGEGHITPMMHLSEFLARRGGFRITFVLQSADLPALERIKRKGTWPPADLDIILMPLESSIPYRPKVKAAGVLKLTEKLEYMMTFQDRFQELLTKLGNVRCIVVDYELGWNIDVALKLGIPGALLFTGCAAWSWMEMEMPSLVSCKQDQEHLIFDHPPIKSSDIPWRFWNHQPFQDLNMTKCHPAIFKATWVLGASCEELEEEMVEAVRAKVGDKFIPVGPLFLLSDDATSAGYTNSDTYCLDWLDKQPRSSVLYISFGSLVSLEAEQFKEFARGVEASEQRFLWVMRAGDPNESYGRAWYESNKELGLMVQWSPQAKVLSHASVGAFLSHCGWNSTAEGICSGQPMLCWPSLFDQNANASLITRYWKIGMGFTKGGDNVVEGGEVERVIKVMMTGDLGMEMRKRARELSEIMKSAVLAGGSSHANLHTFMNDLRTKP